LLHCGGRGDGKCRPAAVVEGNAHLLSERGCLSPPAGTVSTGWDCLYRLGEQLLLVPRSRGCLFLTAGRTRLLIPWGTGCLFPAPCSLGERVLLVLHEIGCLFFVRRKSEYSFSLMRQVAYSLPAAGASTPSPTAVGEGWDEGAQRNGACQ